MGLADEILADFGSSDEEIDEVDEVMEDAPPQMSTEVTTTQDTDPLASVPLQNINLELLQSTNSAAVVPRLLPQLRSIAQYENGATPSTLALTSNLEENPEYHVIVGANEFSVEIDNAVAELHNFISTRYSQRYPELKSLIPNPLQHAQVVAILGNDPATVAKSDNPYLKQILHKSVMMTITMTVDQGGRLLSDVEMATIDEACKLLIALDAAKRQITNYVSSKLNLVAPNTAILIGAHCAAQILGFVGGLNGLAKTPSCNIPSLGAKRETAVGFGQAQRLQGYLYYSDVVQESPADIRKQAMRMLSAKLVLAARLDASRASTDGSFGSKMREEIRGKVQKLAEPPETKGVKALPVPIDKPSKKRGGKRIRKFKEQFKQSEMAAAANRMAFGEAEKTVDVYGETVGLGMLDSAAGLGSARRVEADAKTRARMSKGARSRLEMLKNRPKPMIDGLQSSLSVTAQSMELSKPKGPMTATQDNKFFASGTFTQLEKSSGLQLGPKRKAEEHKESDSPKKLKGAEGS
ncbi:Pre-mRNA-processing factor 31 [Yarrowia sp. C11]|nr:Pre-mRNA-processing factor 31 [Yarrowia sp. E02]KAG5372777.1 Pre-mRNA-processing factor 31 [Yarrowia sp. C11]